jgi:hypothetical protein
MLSAKTRSTWMVWRPHACREKQSRFTNSLSVRTGSWLGPPRGKRASRIGATTALRTPRRTRCPYAYVLITVLRVSRSGELFSDEIFCVVSFETHCLSLIRSLHLSDDSVEDVGVPSLFPHPQLLLQLREPVLGGYRLGCGVCRGTSLIRNNPLLGPYSRTMSRAILWP